MIEKSCLEQIYIASPCQVNWADMPGDDHVRFCGMCSKNVYNISAMSKREAEQFLVDNGVSECLRVYRRIDGTIITDDCPVGLRKIRDGVRRVIRLVSSVLSVALSAAIFGGRAVHADENVKPNLGKILSTTIGTPLGAGAICGVGTGGGIGHASELVRKQRLGSVESIKRLAAECRSSVIAQCLSTNPAPKAGFGDASFKIMKTLKGEPITGELDVGYSANPSPSLLNWSAPKVGTIYLLFFRDNLSQGGPPFHNVLGVGQQIEISDEVLSAISHVEHDGGFSGGASSSTTTR